MELHQRKLRNWIRHLPARKCGCFMLASRGILLRPQRIYPCLPRDTARLSPERLRIALMRTLGPPGPTGKNHENKNTFRKTRVPQQLKSRSSQSRHKPRRPASLQARSITKTQLAGINADAQPTNLLQSEINLAITCGRKKLNFQIERSR